MKKYLVLYIPVLHQGYLNLFEKYSKKVDGLFILGKDIIKNHTYFEREIRALDPGVIQKAVQSLNLFRNIGILNRKGVSQLKRAHIITSSEQITKNFVETYFPKKKVTFDSSFLRWDIKHLAIQTPVNYDRVSKNPFDRKMIKLAQEEGNLSSEWWRQVGALVVKKRKIALKNHNQFLPTEYNAYAFGNIRDFIKAGQMPEVQAALHAEKAIVANAAMLGISLRGADIYLTVFPCQDCARVIVSAGIKRCFYKTGNAHLDVEQILKGKLVEIILVK